MIETRMNFVEQPIEFYLDKMQRGNPFAQAGFSDAEWYSILRKRTGERTGLGQIIDAKHGELLLDVLVRRKDDPKWFFAMPEALWDGSVPILEGDKVGQFLKSLGIILTIYERDQITDDLARDAGLYPLIKQVQQMQSVVIGPVELRNLDFLGTDPADFIAISSPNLHQESDGIEGAVLRAASRLKRLPQGSICLVSAGVSAAIIIDRLYEQLPQHFYWDSGSVWDAFVGIGGQREWRANLYDDPQSLEEWKRKNLGEG